MGAPVEVTHNFQVDFVWKSTSFDRYVHLAPVGATVSASRGLVGVAAAASGVWTMEPICEGRAAQRSVVARAADPELPFQDAERAEDVCRG